MSNIYFIFSARDRKLQIGQNVELLTFEFEKCFEEGCDSHDKKLIDLVKNDLIVPLPQKQNKKINGDLIDEILSKDPNQFTLQVIASKVRKKP